MTKKELISKIKHLPDDAEIFIDSSSVDGCAGDYNKSRVHVIEKGNTLPANLVINFPVLEVDGFSINDIVIIRKS